MLLIKFTFKLVCFSFYAYYKRSFNKYSTSAVEYLLMLTFSCFKLNEQVRQTQLL